MPRSLLLVTLLAAAFASAHAWEVCERRGYEDFKINPHGLILDPHGPKHGGWAQQAFVEQALPKLHKDCSMFRCKVIHTRPTAACYKSFKAVAGHEQKGSYAFEVEVTYKCASSGALTGATKIVKKTQEIVLFTRRNKTWWAKPEVYCN